MKKLLIFFLICCFHQAMSQENSILKISPYAGISIPEANLKEVSDQGTALGISIEKSIKQNIKLGFDFNYSQNPFQSNFDYSIVPNTYQFSKTNNGNGYEHLFLSFGPSYQIGKPKRNLELIARGGISQFKTPAYSETFDPGGLYQNDIFFQSAQKEIGFGFQTGAKLYYGFSDRFGLFLNPTYLVSFTESNYSKKDLTKALFVNGDETFFDPGLLVETPLEEEKLNPSTFQITGGLTFSLFKKKSGGRKEKIPDKIEDSVNSTNNIMVCDVQFTSSCKGTEPIVYISHNWVGYPSNSVINIRIAPGYGSGTINPTNIQLGSTSGNSTHTVVFPQSMSGTMTMIDFAVIGPAGNLICFESREIELENCNSISTNNCDVSLSDYCSDTGLNMLNIDTSWTNTDPSAKINISLFDQNGTPINSTITNNGSITGSTSGSRLFDDIDVSNYAGQTIFVEVSICYIDVNKQPKCCIKRLQIEIGEPCCVNCKGVVLEDNTQIVQGANPSVFTLTGGFSAPAGNPVKYVSIELENFTTSSSSTNSATKPFFEIENSTIGSSTGVQFATLVGNHSTISHFDLSTSPLSNGILSIDVKRQNNELVMSYYAKVTFFMLDGSYCEQTMSYLNY